MTDHMTAKQFQAIAKSMKGARRICAELDTHIAIVNYLNRVLPGHCAFHVPNGEKRDIRTAAKLKRMGTRAGIPDLQVPYYGGKVLWLEVKKPRGRTSKAQSDYINELRNMGHTVAIVESIEDVRNALKSVGIVTRESVQ